MGDYSDEDSLIEVQLPDTTQAHSGLDTAAAPGHLGLLQQDRNPAPGVSDASRLSWSMTEAEMIKLAEKEEQDLIKSSSESFPAPCVFKHLQQSSFFTFVLDLVFPFHCFGNKGEKMFSVDCLVHSKQNGESGQEEYQGVYPTREGRTVTKRERERI